MDVRQAYDEWSTTYDLDPNRTRDLDALVTKTALKDLRCGSILEIGCGTGNNTALLVEIGAQVLALDFSEGMLHKARKKPHLRNVSFAVADLTAPWPCRYQSVDLIVCNLVLEHIEDLAHVFAQASRSLVETGRFFVCELHPFMQYEGAQARFQREHETIQIPAFVHHISDFMDAAKHSGLALERFHEWWHKEDQYAAPRLASFMFRK